MNELRTIHLFAGQGGGLLADIILGHSPIAAVEWDSYSCQVLRDRRDEGWFPGDMLVHEGDIRLWNPPEYPCGIFCIHAGFPCQDLSFAGKQGGLGEGTRSGLYREVLRIAGVVRPKQLFLENVSAILSNGLGTVLGDLAALGYDSRWLCIRASDVGAPHHRDRWFLLANAMREQPHGSGQRAEQEGCTELADCSDDVADTQSQRTRDERENVGPVCGEINALANASCVGRGVNRPSDREFTQDVADSDSDGLQGLESGPQPGQHGRQAGLFSGAGGIHYWSTDPADAPFAVLG